MTESASDRSFPSPRPDGARNFRTVCIAITCVFVVHSMLLVTVPVYALQLGASPLQLGVIFSAPYLLPLVLAIPLGGLVTRYGGRLLMTVGAAAMVSGLLFIVLVDGYVGLLSGQLLLGLAQLKMVLAAQSVISGLGSGPVLERYFGWYTTWLSGGQVVGPLVAGALIDFVETTQLAFIGMVAVALLGGLCAFALTGAARQGSHVDRSVTGYRAQAGLLKRNAGVRVSVAVTVTAMFAMSIHGGYLPVYLEDIGVSAVAMGVLLSLRAVASMLIRPFIARVIASLGGREVAMLVSLATLAAGLVFLGFSEDVLLIGLFSLLVGLGSGISQPLSIVILAENVSSEQRPGALGMRLMANRGINFFAPLSFGLVLEMAGFGAAFFAGGLLVAIAGYLLLRFLKDLENA